MFETNDLVLRKNEKNFILCLLEVRNYRCKPRHILYSLSLYHKYLCISLKSLKFNKVARRGSKFGVPAPVLVQMEEDIDNEIERDEHLHQRDEVDYDYVEEPEIPKEPPKQKVAQDFKSLDEMVRKTL